MTKKKRDQKVLAKTERVWIEVMNGPEDGRIIECETTPISIGRASHSSICLSYDHLISKNHARIVKTGEGFLISDLDSTNGTFIGKERIGDNTPIEPNKLFRVGATELRIRKKPPGAGRAKEKAAAAPKKLKPEKPREARESAKSEMCDTHSSNKAVAECEICGKAICAECVEEYEDSNICSEVCWNQKTSDEADRLVAEDKVRRRAKEKRANRVVGIAVWVVILTLFGAGGFFVYLKMSDHSGDKLWEQSGEERLLYYSAKPDLGVVGFASSDGLVGVIDAITGQRVWAAQAPESERTWRPHLIDEERCLAQAKNRFTLCGAGSGGELWEFTAPLPAVDVEPVILEEAIYVVSSPSYYYFDSSSELEELMEKFSEIMAPSMRENAEKEVEKLSVVSAIDMVSGKERWQMKFENVRVSGLLADEDRVYVACYKHDEYYGYERDWNFETTEESESEGLSEQEDSAVTHLWALNAETGEPDWKLDGTGRFRLPPQMSDEGVVLATESNINLVSADGEMRWQYALKNRYVSSFLPYEDKLLVSTTGGFLICLDLVSGKELWLTQTVTPAEKIVVAFSIVCVPGMIEVEHEAPNVRPTKRWKGSEDLLEEALEPLSGKNLESVLLGVDFETGQKRWAIRNIEDEDFEYADGVVYAMWRIAALQFYDGAADPSDIAKTVTNLGAYDFLTGERIWVAGIDGNISDLRLARGAAIVRARPETLSIASGGGPIPIRLIAISLQ